MLPEEYKKQRKKFYLKYGSCIALTVFASALLGYFELAPLLFIVLPCILIYLSWGEISSVRGYLAYVKGDMDNAVMLGRKAIAEQPTSVTGYMTCAAGCLAQGRAEDAIEVCEQLREFKPKVPEIYINKAAAHIIMLEPGNAVKELRRAIALGKKSVEIYINLANAAVLELKIDDAESNIKRALRINKQNIYAKGIHAMILYEKNMFEDALRICDEAIPKVKSNPDICQVFEYTKAEILDCTGNRKESLKITNKLCSDDYSIQPIAKYKRGIIYCQQKRYVSAQKDFEDMTKVKSSFHERHVDFFQQIGFAYFDICKEEFDFAWKKLDALYKLEVFMPYLDSLKGLTCARQKQYKEALKYLDKSTLSNPYYAWAYWLRSRVHEEMGDTISSDLDREMAEKYKFIPRIDIVADSDRVVTD